jgi:hypothetical protein
MKTLSKFFYKISNSWVVIGAFILFILFCAVMLPQFSQKMSLYSKGVGVPDLKLFYSGTDLYSMADTYSEAGRQSFIDIRWTIDLAFPLIYSFFFITSISWFLRRLIPVSSIWRWLNLIPLVAFVFDICENTATSLVMIRFPLHNFIAQSLAPVFTPLKWLGVLASVFVLIFAVTKYFMNRKNAKGL